MSNLRSFEGLVTVREMPLRGMITLRGDTEVMTAALKSVGFELPERGMCNGAVVWMSPDEVLVQCPHESVGQTLAALQSATQSMHALALDVSDTRTVFEITGAATREVLAKLAPIDLRSAQFPVGKVRRTRLAQIPCAVWLREESAAEAIIFRSVAEYALGVLQSAAHPQAAVGYFASNKM